MSNHRVRGGILLRIAGKLRPVATLLVEAPCPACWRCHRQLSFSDIQFVIGDESFPFVAVCSGCVTTDDRDALA